jgi:hypothetical protein
VTEPSELEPSDSPSAALEADLGSLGDDEYFAAQQALPPGMDDDGREYDPMEGAVDARDDC